MKKRVCLILCLILVFSLLPMSAGAGDARVMLSPQNLTVDGRPIQCEKYNIDGSNYFKLRDIAYLLSGTANQFEVGYDTETRTVTITSGLPYTPNGEELVVGMDKSSTAKPSTQTIKINGVVNSSISAYNLAGNNFFKLRDLGEVIGFTVDYDKASNTAIILSTQGDSPAPGPETGPRALSSKEIFDQCSPAVFFIQTYDIIGEAYATGSGFFIDSTGIAVTNHHVLKNAISATVTLTNGKTCAVAGVLYADRDRDYAVIKVEGSGFDALKIGDSSALSGGDVCYAIGSPKGLQNTISNGIISNPSRKDLGEELIQTTAPISSGSSGGALINEYGEAVGVITSSIPSGQNLNFAIPINAVYDPDQVRAYKNGGSIRTLPQYAEDDAYLEYESRPEMYESMVYASNGFNELNNGDTGCGKIFEDNWDTYFVYCNTIGYIEVYLVTDAGTKYAKDITIAAREYDSDDDYVLGDYATYTDGTEGEYLRFRITKPGVYTIKILSYELYETESIDVDYEFYYQFIPGETNVENTTGSMGEEKTDSRSRQEKAFDALKDWIRGNYNDTIGDPPDIGYFDEVTFSDGSSGRLGVIFTDGNTVNDGSIILYYVYYYTDSAVDYSYIWLSRDTQDCFFSYYYYDDLESDDPAFKGTAFVAAADYSGKRNIVFTDIGGTSADTADRDTMQYYAMISFSDALYFAESIFAEAVQPNGGFSISDFGFDPNDLDVPD